MKKKAQNPIKKLIDFAGSQSALALRCGVRQQSVWKWLQKGKVPPQRALQIEKITNGRFSRHEVCPEFYPRDI